MKKQAKRTVALLLLCLLLLSSVGSGLATDEVTAPAGESVPVTDEVPGASGAIGKRVLGRASGAIGERILGRASGTAGERVP